jgi:hypothetical protein
MSLCTEDEARTKLCPFSLSSSSARRCVASECMAWHFIDRDELRHGTVFGCTRQALKPARRAVFVPKQRREFDTCEPPTNSQRLALSEAAASHRWEFMLSVNPLVRGHRSIRLRC